MHAKAEVTAGRGKKRLRGFLWEVVVKSNLKMIIIISLGKSFVLSYIQISDAKDSDVHVSSFKVSALERQ